MTDRPEITEEEMREKILEAIPSVEQIKELTQGNCYHGKAVWRCSECEPARLFEATVVNLGRELGISEDDARAYAVQLLSEIKNPKCSREGCERPSRFTVRFKLRLRGAGTASGCYEGDIPGGLCAEHREEFDASITADSGREITESICRAQGFALPADALFKLRTEWKPIQRTIH